MISTKDVVTCEMDIYSLEWILNLKKISYMNAKYFWTVFNDFLKFASRQGDFEMPFDSLI